MKFPVVVIGENVKEQLAPYWKLHSLQWNDVTELYMEKWLELGDQYGDLDTFAKWLHFYNFWPADKLPDNPLAKMRYRIDSNGFTKAFIYENPAGFWSYYQLGKDYTDFFLLKNGKTAWRTNAGCLDLARDIKETGKKLAKHWIDVREAAKKEKPMPWNFSRALHMDKEEYIKKRTADNIVPDAIVWADFYPPSTWLWLYRLPPEKRLQKYSDILMKLSPETMLTVVECHD